MFKVNNYHICNFENGTLFMSLYTSILGEILNIKILDFCEKFITPVKPPDIL